VPCDGPLKERAGRVAQLMGVTMLKEVAVSLPGPRSSRRHRALVGELLREDARSARPMIATFLRVSSCHGGLAFQLTDSRLRQTDRDATACGLIVLGEWA